MFHQNDVFHLTMLEAAHHERLTQVLIRTVDHTLVFQAFRHYDEAGMTRSAVFHGLIAEAMPARRGARAPDGWCTSTCSRAATSCSR